MYIHVHTWSNFVGTVFWLSSMLWTQIALEKELGTCIPTILQVNIKTIFLNAVRIWWNYNYSVLHIPKLYISVFDQCVLSPQSRHPAAGVGRRWC